MHMQTEQFFEVEGGWERNIRMSSDIHKKWCNYWTGNIYILEHNQNDFTLGSFLRDTLVWTRTCWSRLVCNRFHLLLQKKVGIAELPITKRSWVLLPYLIPNSSVRKLWPLLLCHRLPITKRSWVLLPYLISNSSVRKLWPLLLCHRLCSLAGWNGKTCILRSDVAQINKLENMLLSN
jgi:hypothetical protein